MDTYLAFIAAAGLLLILPGPTNALLMTAGAGQKLRRALPLIPVELAAYALAITPLLIFHEALGSWRAIGGLVLKSVAIAIILLIAYRLWRARPSDTGAARLVEMPDIFWMTLFNPKALIFAFAIFPPVFGATDVVVKAVLFLILATLAAAAWIVAGAMLSANSIGSSKIGKAAAVILCGFAVYMAMSVVGDAGAVFSNAQSLS
jgi:threonine/homoserine/homoserine lactone efflux protein